VFFVLEIIGVPADVAQREIQKRKVLTLYALIDIDIILHMPKL